MMKTDKVECFFAVNLSKMGWPTTVESYIESFAQWQQDTGYDAEHLLLPMHGTGVSFGPFENEKNASMMPASTLNEKNEDFFGDMWAIVAGETGRRTVFFKPRVNDARMYVCSDAECGGIQRFKGSCSKCKAAGKELVRTVEVRDFDGRLSQ